MTTRALGAALVLLAIVLGAGCKPTTGRQAVPVPEPAPAVGLDPARVTDEIVVVDYDGQVFAGRLPEAPRKIADLPHGGVTQSHAFWSPDGKRLLLFADLCSSSNWFLWDRREFTTLFSDYEPSDRAKRWRIPGRFPTTWLGPNEVVTNVWPPSGRRSSPSRAYGPIEVYTITPPRRVRTIRPAPESETYQAWLAPDRAHIVVLAGNDLADRCAVPVLIETWDLHGRKLGAQAEDVYGTNPVSWSAPYPGHFAVRTGPCRFEYY